MTPKEKAIELFNKFYALNYEWDGGLNKEWAKESALIAVKEIKKSAPLKPLHPLGAYPYWQEVKQEIENL